MDERKDILEFCKELAVKAGHEIMKIYNSHEDLQVEYKPGEMPLTMADRLSNRVIVEELRERYGGYGILSEEEKDDRERLEKDECFVIDPLDGTKEFLKRNGQFTVNIALSYRHRSVMGVIYAPAAGELYYAAEGMGSWLKDREGKVLRLHVSERTGLDQIRLVMSSSHGCRQMEELIEKYQFRKFVKLGSSLKGCMIARGDAEVYYRYNPTMEWDTAAMQCIAEEAGAVFRQMDDSEMFYNRENPLNEKGFYIINDWKNRV